MKAGHNDEVRGRLSYGACNPIRCGAGLVGHCGQVVLSRADRLIDARSDNIPAAILFYALYVVGVVIFAVSPAFHAGSWRTAIVLGALFGFFAYATYDTTNLATLRGWPIAMVVVDIAWGTFLTAISATAGFLATQRLFPASGAS